MKPINYILSLASVCVLFACGNEDTPKEILPSVIEPDATISLLVNTGEKAQLKSFTKADAPTIDDNKIARLTVAVFNAGAYDGHAMGALEVLQTEEAEGEQPITQVEDIEVKSGPVKVLVLANLPESLLSKFTTQGGTFTIDNFIGKGAETTVLSDEINVTASSEVYDITTQRGKVNCLGYAKAEVENKTNGVSVSPTTLGENAIPLYRNVSRVLLNKIKFEPKEQYIDASLEIKGIYVANVKSKSYLASKANGRGSVEVADIAEDNFYWCGAFDEETGSLKEGKARNMSDLLLYTPESSMILDSEKKQVDGAPIGKPFYIYQNQAGKNHTLLIVYGTFKYKLNEADDEYQEQQSFYTVIVNEPGKGSFEPGSEEHEYVTRNFNYNIELTISGSGSTEPYDKAISSNLSTSVKVLPWNVKIIHEDVE
ncbi:fimbrial protein [uncultured Parabacteroides sp.]|uniref:fimbrial protein n=1 Tax=uncultured Parabacteroides sp. TaxID=512312 RepID=UPI00259B6BEB|nr:fimbrial protein [uncultured Parabacteroides sp.]